MTPDLATTILNLSFHTLAAIVGCQASTWADKHGHINKAGVGLALTVGAGLLAILDVLKLIELVG